MLGVDVRFDGTAVQTERTFRKEGSSRHFSSTVSTGFSSSLSMAHSKGWL